MFETQPRLNTEEARFRTIFDQSPVSTQIFSSDGRTVTVNPAWERLWGVTLAQLGDYNILEDEQLERKGIMPYIRRGFAGEFVDIPAIKYEPAQTKPIAGAVPYRWVRASIYPVKDAEGNVREVVLMHEDITETVEAEDALHESEERFRAIFDGAPIGISLLDLEGRYLAVNPARQRMLGRCEAELIGRSFREFTHPDDLDFDAEVNERARAQQQDWFQIEKRFVRSDGAVRWDRITVSMLRDERGEATYSVAIAEDTTERKEAEGERSRLLDAEREARRQLERLAAEREAILGQIAEGIIIADRSGGLVFANNAARSMHGDVQVGAPIGSPTQPYRLLTMDGEPYPTHELPLARAVWQGETTINAQWRVLRSDGLEIVARGSAAPVLADDGSHLGAVLVMRDTTAEHRLEQQKDEFLSALAHDLRTPLTSIRGRVQLMRQRLTREGSIDPARLQDDLSRIDSSTSRVTSLIVELLDVANLQIGRLRPLDLHPTDLVALAREVAQEHRQVAPHPVRFESELAELIGQWDSGRIERVLANLLSNATKYSPQGGEITVRVRHEPGWAVIEVADRGIGIPAEEIETIFDRFHRGQNAAGRIPGTGIGLSTVRSIVAQHGGEVSVRSQEGEGSAFTVRLPTALPPSHRTAPL